jgi:DNA-binding NarL/FixJ family response regulator
MNLEVCGEADCGEASVELARTLQPDAAVVDISLPKMSGIELTIADKSCAPRMAVLIFSMHDESS